jgi:hypothetical protein
MLTLELTSLKYVCPEKDLLSLGLRDRGHERRAGFGPGGAG